VVILTSTKQVHSKSKKGDQKMFKKTILIMVIFGFCFTEVVFAGYPYENVCPSGGKVFSADYEKIIRDNQGNIIDRYWVDKWGFAQCNCTSYCAYMMDSVIGREFDNSYGETGSWSHGNNWDYRAGVIGISVDSTPLPGDIAYWNSMYSGDIYGHVAYVERVKYNSNMNPEEITIREYNYSANSYTRRTISSDNPSGFIHLLAYHEGVSSLFYLDSWEMDQAATEQTKQEWLWIMQRVWNNYRCTTNCNSDYSDEELAFLHDYVIGMGGGGDGGDPPPDPDSDDDVHIVSMEIRKYKQGSFVPELYFNLKPGASISLETEAKVKNEGSNDLEDVDIDTRVDASKRRFDEDDTNMGDDQDDIDAGDINVSHSPRITAKVADDGKSVRVQGDGSAESFDTTENRVTLYFFITADSDNDSDISSPHVREEYAKVNIYVELPPPEEPDPDPPPEEKRAERRRKFKAISAAVHHMLFSEKKGCTTFDKPLVIEKGQNLVIGPREAGGDFECITLTGEN
jgi:surface antigen